MGEIILIRGVPGSGKTTIAKRDFPNHVHCEADQFFEGENGYKFDRNNLSNAHEYCFEKAKQAVLDGKNAVISNTFTRLWEMQKYLDLASLNGYSVRVIRADGDFKNIHDCPERTVYIMRRRFEDYSGEEIWPNDPDGDFSG